MEPKIRIQHINVFGNTNTVQDRIISLQYLRSRNFPGMIGVMSVTTKGIITTSEMNRSLCSGKFWKLIEK